MAQGHAHANSQSRSRSTPARARRRLAKFERALIRERTRAALRAKRARGERAGNVPWGFRTAMDGKLEPREDELRVTERVHALRAEGRPLRAISRTLASDGVSDRTGRALTLTQVARIARLSRSGA